MSTLEKLHALEKGAHIYQISWRNAGIGVMVYEGPYDEQGIPPENWKEHLITPANAYARTFEEAIDRAYVRMQKLLDFTPEATP